MAIYGMQKSLFDEESMVQYEGDVPTSLEGFYNITVQADSPFTITVNGKKSELIRTLEVRDKKPLTVDQLSGILNIYHSGGAGGIAEAQQLLLEVQEGSMDIWRPDISVALAELARPDSIGTVVHLRDPDYVVIDGTEYRNLDSVAISELDGKVALERQF